MDSNRSTPAWRSTVAAIAWTLAWLVVLDVGTRFAIQAVARRHPDSSLVRYFEYGQSIEAKLDRMTRLPAGSPDGLILAAGWLDPGEWRQLPDRPAPGTDKLVAVYGQSFANNVSVAAAQLDGHLTLRAIGGPAAPPDHSYAAYIADTANGQADTVVFGILASAVAHMGSMSGIDWTFEHPAPFTFPFYSLQEGALQAEQPVFRTEQQFRAAYANQSGEWRAFKAQLARHDRGFDPLTFDRTWWDRSQTALLMRRGWAAHSQDYNAGVYEPGKGFVAESQQLQVLRAMLVDLGKRTRARGQRLIVLLEQDQGYGDALYRALGPTLREAGIETVSTHEIFSADDPGNFIRDGHYTQQANLLFARRLATLIRTPPPAAIASR